MATKRKSRRSRQGDPDDSEPELKLEMAEKEIALLREELKKLNSKTNRPSTSGSSSALKSENVDTSSPKAAAATAEEDTTQAPLTSMAELDSSLPAPASAQLNNTGNQPSSLPLQPMNYNRVPDRRVPGLRKIEYDGKRPWESFIRPFEDLANACNWGDEERRFRMLNSLRDEAAEYVYSVIPQEALSSLELLKEQLKERFGEKRSPNAYLAELEQKKLGSKELLAEYVSDIKRLVLKGYPTADTNTRETIGLRHFIRGLSDQQMIIAVGMRNPKTIEAAKEALETYLTLRDELGKTQNRVRVIQPSTIDVMKDTTKESDTEYIAGAQFKELVATLDKRFQGISKLVKGSGKPSEFRKSGNNKRDFRCYSCDEEGHIARNCPIQGGKGNAEQNQGKTNQSEN